MNSELISEVHGHVMHLTINRPERRNAMTPAVLEGISQGIDYAERNNIRAIVLTGAGNKAFCAGADLQSGDSFKFDYSEPNQAISNLFRRVRRAQVPLIARVNGACVAGGMGLMAMCDLAVATEDARFGLPEVKVGVFPAQVLSVLQNLVGKRFLNELCLCGELISAQEALDAGLINYVSSDLDGKLDWLLNRLLDKSPAAIRRGLYTLKQVDTLPFEQAVAFTESQIGLFALTEDSQEGQLAFREKRAPIWTGK